MLNFKYKEKNISTKTLESNIGQIPGVHANPRTITKDEYQKLKDSISRNGIIKARSPIVYEHDGRYVVICGNMRLKASKELGLTDIPVFLIDETLTPEQLNELDIIDNKQNGEWDWDLLANEWPQENLEEWGLDTAQEWDGKKELPEDIDETPEPPKTPISKLGDLWLLGNHRVLCGDSTDKATVERLMDGKKADMVFTDPPYGMKFQSNFRTKTSQFQKIQNDDIVLDITGTLKQIMNENSVAYICTRWDLYPQWYDQIQAILNIKNCIVWYKRGGGLGDLKNTYLPNHEFLIVGHKGTNQLRGKRDADVWEIGRDGFNNYEHPTQKPVALPTFAIEHHSDVGQIVADLFLGSGSTLIACEQTERICYGLELEPQYIDVICKRYQQLTGELPILESTGEAHNLIEE